METLLKPTLTQLLDELGKVRQQAADIYKEYKAVKEIEDQLRQTLLLTLKEVGLKQAKNDNFIVSVTETPTVVITDERAVIEWLENTPNVESDFYIGVNKPAFNTLAKQMLKETGELASGTDVEVRESLAIRKAT